MSVDSVERWTWSRSGIWSTVRAAVFGDRTGLAIFLASACLFAVCWRTSVFINDSYALANGLYSLSNGRLVLTEAVYGPGLETPGVRTYGGELLSRNYGVIVLSLPFLWAIDALGNVVAPRIGVLALWSLALLALVVQVGHLTGRRWVRVLGSGGVLVVFAANVALAEPLAAKSHLHALQLFHLTVAAFGPVLLYRLLGHVHTPRVGLLGALLFALGTPLAFWATVPKRHVITATVVLGIAYALYRSRVHADGAVVENPLAFRALAYALVGLYAWVHAPEALLLGTCLAAADVGTADDNSPRTLAVLTAAFAVSLVPFFITNTLIADSPLRPPRLLAATGATGETTAASGGGTAARNGGESPFAPLADALETALSPLTLLVGELVLGFETALRQPGDIFHAYVRSGSSPDVLNRSNEEAVNLSVLESAPILAAVTALVPTIRRWWPRASLPDRTLSATRVVDCFAVLAAVGFALLYATRLPVHAQVTARYLFVLFPLGVYGVLRLPPVREALTGHWRLFCWTLAACVFVGGQLVVVAVALGAAGLGEAFQLHALLSLSAAAPLGLWALAGRSEGRYGQLGAVLLALATSAALLFTCLAAVEYYPVGGAQALPIVRTAGDLLPLA
ncbi:hypothetical protein [Haloarcula marina]|uniref:hypothetical protein n=1 Tax=Haloarcula marina TaxID=2961574 RepID=UPI0020B7B1EF|nr:hypothetical protein [Halomicroarcula marina]